MAVADTLKKFRSQDYGPKGDAPEEGSEDAPETPRTIRLTDDEAKSLQPFQVHPGEEIVLEVSGKLEDDGHFHVMSVKYANPSGMGDEDAAKVAGVEPPMMQMQTQPSPS